MTMETHLDPETNLEAEPIHLSEKEYLECNSFLANPEYVDPEDNPNIVDWMERHGLDFNSGLVPAFFKNNPIWLDTSRTSFLNITDRAS